MAAGSAMPSISIPSLSFLKTFLQCMKDRKLQSQFTTNKLVPVDEPYLASLKNTKIGIFQFLEGVGAVSALSAMIIQDQDYSGAQADVYIQPQLLQQNATVSKQASYLQCTHNTSLGQTYKVHNFYNQSSVLIRHEKRRGKHPKLSAISVACKTVEPSLVHHFPEC